MTAYCRYSADATYLPIGTVPLAGLCDGARPHGGTIPPWGVTEEKRDGNNPEFRWQKDPDTGKLVMPAIQVQFLDWLLTFPRAGTQAEWARENNVDERGVRRWKADPRFKREWDARAQELNLSPERVQAVLDNLYEIASVGNGAAAVKAGALYLEYVGKFMPARKIVVEGDDLESLSNEDLALMAAGETS